MEPKISKYKGLSSKEVDLLARLEYEGKEVYTRTDIDAFCVDQKKADYLIRRLLIKKRLKSIVKNVYLFIPMKAPMGRWVGNEYVIAKALVKNSKYYIGYANVFNSYGFTEQVAQIIHIANEKYSMQKRVCGVTYKLIKVLPDRLYGIETRTINNQKISFPSRERALIDVFDSYTIQKASLILKEQISKIDKQKFIDYVAQYPVQIIRRRIGYFLEKAGIQKKLLKKIDVGEKGYSCLYDTGVKTGNIDKKWRIIING